MWRVTFVLVLACGTNRPAPAARGRVTWSPPVEVATGGGERGPWEQNESRFDHVDDPTVALPDDGSMVIAWVDHRDKDVHLQRSGERPTNVSRTGAVFSWLPRIAVRGDDVYVLWQEIVFSGGSHGGDMLFARSRDRGRTFGVPINLSASRDGDGKGRIDARTWNNGSFDLALAPDDVLFVAWTTYEGGLWLARSDDRGETFSSPRQVGGSATRPARGPSLAAGAGVVHLAWAVGEEATGDIHIVSSPDGQVFGPVQIVERTAGYSDAPKLVLDDVGVLHLAFAEGQAGPFDRHDVRYTQSRDGGVTWEPTRTISRPAPAGTVSAAFPSLAVAGDTVHVSWELYPDVDEAPHGLAIATSLDGGRAFSPPARIPGTADPGGGRNGSFQGRLMKKLAVRGDEVAVVNSSLAIGEGSRVWVVRGVTSARGQTRGEALRVSDADRR